MTPRPTILHAALIAAPALAHGQPAPRFENYPAGPPFTGHSRLLLQGPAEWAFRTRLRDAARQPPDFAAHYRLAVWGCGTSCLSGAAVDLRSGRVIWLPGTVSSWTSWESAPPDTEPVLYRRDSRLIVLSGTVDESGSGPGHHYYRIDNGRFIPVADRPFTRPP